MGFQKQICSILCFAWLIRVKFCVLQISLSKTQMFLVKKNLNSMNIDLTVLEVDSLCLQIILTFVTIIFCLSLVKNS